MLVLALAGRRAGVAWRLEPEDAGKERGKLRTRRNVLSNLKDSPQSKQDNEKLDKRT